MLRSVKDLTDYAVDSTDGDIGKVSDVYFDDDAWVVRYLVVDAGSWLEDRRVLISPISMQTANWNENRIRLSLTRDQVRKSPDIDTHKPISRQNEMLFNQYYGWSYYWAGTGIWGAGMYPGLLAGESPTIPVATEDALNKPQDPQDTHLRSADDVKGYRIHARDGEIGHLSDFIIDDESWRINYLVISTSNWLPGKKVIVPPTWVQKVSWADQEITVDLKRETIKNSPEFSPETLLNKA